jgi:hypothetical protein
MLLVCVCVFVQVLAVIIVLLVIAILVVLFFWMRSRKSARGASGRYFAPRDGRSAPQGQSNRVSLSLCWNVSKLVTGVAASVRCCALVFDRRKVQRPVRQRDSNASELARKEWRGGRLRSTASERTQRDGEPKLEGVRVTTVYQGSSWSSSFLFILMHVNYWTWHGL